MKRWLPAPATATRMWVAGGTIWMLAAAITFVSGSSSTLGLGAASLLGGLLFLPTGPLAFWDVEGFGSDWVRRVPNGARLDADKSRSVAQFMGAMTTLVAAGWVVFGAGLLWQSLTQRRPPRRGAAPGSNLCGRPRSPVATSAPDRESQMCVGSTLGGTRAAAGRSEAEFRNVLGANVHPAALLGEIRVP